ncbi:MAG: hypothetical protein ACI9XU_000468 [Arenicella sp.]|jgi:hypothetical protein
MSKRRKTPSPPKRRNSVALNPLLKKSHAHSTSQKAERAKDKQALKKELAENQ